MHRAVTAGLAALLVFLSGCACTEIGCEDSIEVVLVPAGGTVVPGTYRMTVEHDDGVESCELVVDDECLNNNLCQGDCWLAYRSGSQLTMTVVATSVPDSARIVIERDGVVVGDETFQPDYDRLQPNGRLCSPTCYQATETMMIQ